MNWTSFLAGPDEAARITVQVDPSKVPPGEDAGLIEAEAIRAARLLVSAPIGDGLRGGVCDFTGQVVGAWAITDAAEDDPCWYGDDDDIEDDDIDAMDAAVEAIMARR